MASPIICDCCGSPFSGNVRIYKYCLRCGYPIEVDVEQQFLRESLHSLRRTMAFGGADMTVPQLVDRYQQRLSFLQAVATPNVADEPAIPQENRQPATALEAANSLVEDAQRPVFSLRTFFTDQAINVFSALGAFLILVGSLSFVITTSNRLLSFLVLLVVHLFIGGIGIFAYRFRSFRTVSAIYTTIFALLLPLVGFTAIQWIIGNEIFLSPPTLVAIVATYATIIYCWLALYQHFSPFGYLSMAALIVADLAVALALHLAYWWWPDMLMLLSFPIILILTHPALFSRLSPDAEILLRGPLKFLLVICNGVTGLYLILASSSTLVQSFIFFIDNADNQPFNTIEVRFALASVSLLLLLWFCLYSWYRSQTQWIHTLPGLLLATVLSYAYAFQATHTGYVLALIGVALFCTALQRSPAHLMQRFVRLRTHLNVFVLCVIGLLALVVDPITLFEIIARSYASSHPLFIDSSSAGNFWLSLIALLAGFLLSLGIILERAGLHKTPEPKRIFWCRFLFLDGLVGSWLLMLIVLREGISPLWSIFAFTILLALVAFLIRFFTSAYWSRPVDLLALCFSGLTICMSFSLDANYEIAILLVFAILSYALLVFQKRPFWLFVPFLFMLMAIIPLSHLLRILLIISLLFPFGAAFISRFTAHQDISLYERLRINRVIVVAFWDWPILAAALIYGLVLLLTEQNNALNTLQVWSGINQNVAMAVEGALLALAWYCAGLLGKAKWYQVATVIFALIALRSLLNNFWDLFWAACILTPLAMLISKYAGRAWAWSCYTAATIAALLAGINSIDALSPLQPGAISIGLFVFAGLAYAVLLLERKTFLLFFVAGFTCWGIEQLPVGFRHIGALALTLLAVSIFAYGRGQKKRALAHWCAYAAGFCLALIAAWELPLFQQTELSVVTLIPASYCIIIAPFMQNDPALQRHNLYGQICSIVGATLLLLPTLWSSFGPTELEMTLLLIIEALALCIAGLGMRMRFLVLSGAALVIVGAIHFLFLPSFGISPFIAFALTGVLLLFIATILIIIRPRLSAFWQMSRP